MPEYLAPGVYVEEVSFRSKSIEGVPTSTTGFAGTTSFGPVQYPGGPRTTEPRLITSFTEFERVYGGLEPLQTAAASADPEEERLSYLAHAARAFFDNGGKRLYVSRVYAPRDSGGGVFDDYGVASAPVPVAGGAGTATWTARWPGRLGAVLVETRVVRSGNVAYQHATFGVQAQRAKPGTLVEITAGATQAGNTPPVAQNVAVVEVDADGQQTFVRLNGTSPAPTASDVLQILEMQVIVTVDLDRVDVYNELAADPRQKR